MPQQPFRNELADRRRTTLLLFYLAALLSVIAVSVAAKIPSFRTFLFFLAVAGAGTAIVSLLRFLRANDEHERQINYRALTFAFVGTLAFAAGCRFSPEFRFSSRLLARHSPADDHSVEHWIDSVFVAVSMKTRLRVLRAEKEWSQAELAAHVGVARGTINAIETDKYDPSLPLAFKIARAFGKTVEEVFLYQENEQPATTNPAV